MLELKRIPLAEVQGSLVNPKQHNLDGLKSSMRRYGFTEPVLINDRTGVLLAGHGRVDALRALQQAGEPAPPGVLQDDGDWSIPYIAGISLEQAEAEAYRIDANLATIDGGHIPFEQQARAFDKEILATSLERLLNRGALPEFVSESNAQALIAELLADPEDEDFDLLGALGEDDLEVRVDPGDVWALGRHRLMCGDSTDPAAVGLLVGDTVFHAVLTDPPYGIEHDDMPGDDPKQLPTLYRMALARWPIADAVVVAFQSPRMCVVWLDAIRAAGHQVNRLLWLFRRAGDGFPWRGWILKSDVLPVSEVGEPAWPDWRGWSRGGTAIVLSSVDNPDWPMVSEYVTDTYVRLELDDEADAGWAAEYHPTLKPLWVCRDIIMKLPGGAVADPFLGSGTTLIACEQLKRTCYGMEIDPRYCEVAIRRWESLTGLTAVRVE